MAQFRLEKGKSIPTSTYQSVMNAFGLSLAIGFCALLAYFGGVICYNVFLEGSGPWAVGVFLALPMLVIGTFAVVFLAYMLVHVCLNLILGERLLIGHRALQRVQGSDAVLDHIPYSNIDDVRVVEVVDNRGRRPIYVTKVSIRLIEPEAEDTIVRVSVNITPGESEDEYYIEPLFRASPHRIGELLAKRWRNYQTKGDRDDGGAGNYSWK